MNKKKKKNKKQTRNVAQKAKGGIKRAFKPKKRVSKKSIKIKRRKVVSVRRKKIISSKKHKKVKSKKLKRKKTKSDKNVVMFLSLGKIHPSRGRILALIVSIIFMTTGMLFSNVLKMGDAQAGQVAGVSIEIKKNSELEKGIKRMVQGYPIEKMAPFIATKDPQTAAFLVAIAKKESNWGKRRPVLNGQDCYNYWGFRLKAERMGSGGHTCFDSPKQAVNIVASRIDEMIKEENMDSPKDMIVWKCGYGCQDEEKSKSELKWISDVSLYYDKLSGYL